MRSTGGLRQDALYSLRRKSLVFAAGLDFHRGSHRRAQREDAQDVARVGHALAAAQKHDGSCFLDGPDEARRDGGIYSGMGGYDDTGELHNGIRSDNAGPAAVQKLPPFQMRRIDTRGVVAATFFGFCIALAPEAVKSPRLNADPAARPPPYYLNRTP